MAGEDCCLVLPDILEKGKHLSNVSTLAITLSAKSGKIVKNICAYQ